MKSLSRRRQQHDARAALATGRSPFSPRLSLGQIATADLEGSVFRLPANSEIITVQNPDGSFPYMLDYDPLESAPLP